MSITRSRLFLIVAFVFFVLATLISGGVISSGELGWLVPAGLASLTLAFLL